KALIEIALCFGRVRRDLARIGAEAVIKRLLRGEHITNCKHDRRTDEDLTELALRFHSKTATKNLSHGNCLSSAVTALGSMILCAKWKPPPGRRLLMRNFSSAAFPRSDYGSRALRWSR